MADGFKFQLLSYVVLRVVGRKKKMLALGLNYLNRTSVSPARICPTPYYRMTVEYECWYY